MAGDIAFFWTRMSSASLTCTTYTGVSHSPITLTRYHTHKSHTTSHLGCGSTNIFFLGRRYLRYPVRRHQTAVIPRQTATIWWPIPSQTEIEDVKYPVKPNITLFQRGKFGLTGYRPSVITKLSGFMRGPQESDGNCRKRARWRSSVIGD